MNAKNKLCYVIYKATSSHHLYSWWRSGCHLSDSPSDPSEFLQIDETYQYVEIGGTHQIYVLVCHGNCCNYQSV